MSEGKQKTAPTGLRAKVERLEMKLQGLQAENRSLLEKLIEGRRSVESLSETLLSYQRGLEGSGISLAIVDSEMTILDANEAIEKLTGYRIIELRDRMRWTDLVCQEDRSKLEFYLQMRAENPENPPSNYEFRLQDRSGNKRSVLVNVRPIPRSAKYVATFLDVSLLKTTEQALRDMEEKYLALFDNSLDIIFVFDFDGNIMDANRAALEVFGYDRHEVRDLNITTLLDEKDYGRAMQEIALVHREKRNTEILDWQVRTKSGSRVWLEITAARMDREGQPYAIVGLARDITERRKAEDALKASEARFRAMFENASEMIYIYDAAGRFIDMNEKSLALLGCSRSDIRSLSLRDIVDPEDYTKATRGLNRLFSVGESLGPIELRLRLDDGTRRWMEVSSVRLDLGDERFVALGIARDVTGRKDAEQKLEAVHEQVRASQKMEAVGRLAAGIAHEFSNVLNVIGGHTELSLEGLHREDPIRESLEEIRKASESGSRLMKQLLAFSSAQMIRPEVIEVNDCVRNAGAVLARLIGEDIELVTRLGEAGRVRVDPSQLERAILNLAVNARDAMPDGGKLILETYDADLDDEYASSHAGVKPGSYVILALTDTGVGMDEQTRQRIFEPFFTTREGDLGSGMGLATVFGFVKQSGGNVWVYSEPGRGSTFKIYLPRLGEDDEPIRDSSPDLGSLMGVETVLVVEDEDMVRNIVSLTLREHGYSVLEARQAQEALEIFQERSGQVDVVVSDVVMPGMNGRQLASELKKRWGHDRILLVSGYPGTAAEYQKLVDDGMAFVSKPVAGRTLVKKVRELLDRPDTDAS